MQTQAQFKNISFELEIFTPSIKYALQFKFKVLTTDRRYLVYRYSWNTLKYVLCFYVYRADESDKDRKYSHWSLGEGRGIDLWYSSWKLWKIKTSPKISLSVKLRCQSALFSVDDREQFLLIQFLSECSLQSKLRGIDFHFFIFCIFRFNIRELTHYIRPSRSSAGCELEATPNSWSRTKPGRIPTGLQTQTHSTWVTPST